VSVGHTLPDLRLQALAVLLGVPLVTAAFGHIAPWLLLLLLAFFGAVIGLQYFWMRSANRRISRSELAVEYLLRRIEETVSAAGGAGHTMPSIRDSRQTWPRATPAA
jgi:hypothetical protein